MQLVKVDHLKFALEARLQLFDHVSIACQDDEIYIYDYNYNVIASLSNIQRVVRMAPCKVSIHKEYVHALVPCSSRLLQSIEQFFGFAYDILSAILHKPLRLLYVDDHVQFKILKMPS